MRGSPQLATLLSAPGPPSAKAEGENPGRKRMRHRRRAPCAHAAESSISLPTCFWECSKTRRRRDDEVAITLSTRVTVVQSTVRARNQQKSGFSAYGLKGASVQDLQGQVGQESKCNLRFWRSRRSVPYRPVQSHHAEYSHAFIRVQSHTIPFRTIALLPFLLPRVIDVCMLFPSALM
jgi:hypothetical protein